MKKLVFLFTLACCATSLAASTSETSKLKSIASASHRSQENIARNDSRHPVETLEFFGIKEDMTVIEISPGGGWYTEILAPFLKDKGQYIAAGYNPESKVEYFAKAAKRFSEKLAAHPDVYSKTKVSVMEPPSLLDYAKENSADMVLTFRNTHNWLRRGDAEAVFKSFAKVLKPGGVLGLVQHRANDDQDTQGGKFGYLKESEVINLAKMAGLEFVASSDVNANPKDTKNYEKGVWTLPPVYRMGDQDKEKYQAIGESDRMTLKFIKPKK